MRWALIVALGLVAAYLATGLAVVGQDEVGVVRRCGAVQAEPWGPGLHWGLPLGLGRVDRVKINQTRSLSVGAAAAEAAPLSSAPDAPADDVLTGDLNLVTARATLQYRVAEPAAFLFRAREVDRLLSLAAESALAAALGGRAIDDVLTTGRAEVADRMARSIQADAAGLGISVRAVRLGRVAPPLPVAPAFADADRARSDRRQAITRAEEYRDRARAEARGGARETLDRAEAGRDRAVRLAGGEARRFAEVLASYRAAPEATRRRLYLEALGELLPRFARTVVVEPGGGLDLGLIAGDDDRPETP